MDCFFESRDRNVNFPRQRYVIDATNDPLIHSDYHSFMLTVEGSPGRQFVKDQGHQLPELGVASGDRRL